MSIMRDTPLDEEVALEFSHIFGGMPYGHGAWSGRSLRPRTIGDMLDMLVALQGQLRMHAQNERERAEERESLKRDLKGTAGLLRRVQRMTGDDVEVQLPPPEGPPLDAPSE